jgi:uncharacterized iron-regulated membrane protein
VSKTASRRNPWPRVPAAFVRNMLAGHSALGLAFGALIYLVCLTGTLAVFVNELQVWEQADAPVVTAPDAVAVDRAAHAALDAAGEPIETLYVSIPTIDGQRLIVTARGATEKEWVADGHGILAAENRADWTDFVGDLHMTLMLPEPFGDALVGVIGVGLFALLLSGILAHPRIFRDSFALRLGGTRRLREADLHNRLSVWGLPFHVAVTLTGAFFGLSTILIYVLAAVAHGGNFGQVAGVLDGPQVAANSAAAPLPNIADLLAQVRAARPDGNPTFVGIDRPGTAGQRVMIMVDAPRHLVRGDEFYFDGTGRNLTSGGLVAGSMGLQAYAAAASLHFGTFGGEPVKLVYGVLGLALTVISAGGVAIWLIRRRDQGRPLPRLERAWAGIVWGAPLAIAVAAIATQACKASPSPVFWTVWLVLTGATLILKNGEAASRWLRLGLAMALLGMIVSDALIFGAAALSGFALWVNVVLLLAAATIGEPFLNASPLGGEVGTRQRSG